MTSSKEDDADDKAITASTTGSSSWGAPEHLFETAILYDSFQNPQQCGHAVPLDRLVRRLQQQQNGSSNIGSTKLSSSCPTCQKPVVYVVDGCVDKKDYDTVTFKYGKQIYCLSVPPLSVWQEWQRLMQLRQHQSKQDRDHQRGYNFYYYTLWWWCKWPLEMITTAGMRILSLASPLSSADRGPTAHARIAQVLGLDLQHGMKILSKGKVVYPSSPAESSVWSNQEFSNQLLDKVSSKIDSDEEKRTTAPKWLVMGTPAAQQLAPRKDQQQTSYLVRLLSSTLQWIFTFLWSTGISAGHWLMRMSGGGARPPANDNTTATRQRHYRTNERSTTR